MPCRFQPAVTLFLLAITTSFAQDDAIFFERRVLPMMEETCAKCHEPEDSKGDVPFLEATEAGDIGKMRGVWRSVAAQLRNRTMPPPEKKQPTEEDRAAVEQWLTGYLRRTALAMPPHAGDVPARRLNRLEYDLTVQDICGVDLNFSERLPMDTGGGEGFDNNGESLYLPPILMERYLEAAAEIADSAIISPPLDVTMSGSSALVAIHVEGDYRVSAQGGDGGEFVFKVDGAEVARGERNFVKLRLGRGNHLIEAGREGSKRIKIQQQPAEISKKKKAAHKLLLGEAKTRDDARAQLAKFLRNAYRRPVEPAEIDKLMRLYDRAADRGDPFEERFKLALRGALVSPDFLFRIEKTSGEGLQPLSAHELAARLSYFLWSRPPDAELSALADSGTLAEDAVLRAQIDRLIDDPRSLTFARAFTGQWLGTKAVGGRIAPVHNTKDRGYTNEIAADMREEGARYFYHMVRKNRSVFELVDSDYAFATRRLAAYYNLEVPKTTKGVGFHKLPLKDRRRGGILGMGAVHAVTSHQNTTSPVLRGAWVFDTLLGSPVPPPPADVPPLAKSRKKTKSEREALEQHRQDAACMACHRMIDPIGFGLENFDRLGRWREKDEGVNIDASGEFPTGERFDGPAEMKRVLLQTQSDLILRQVIRKLLGYAIGRNLTPADDGTIERIAIDLEKHNHGTRRLIHGIVASPQFGSRGGN